MDETYGTYVDDECFDVHDYDDTDHDTHDDTGDDTDNDTNDDTDDVLMMMLDLVLARMSILEEIRT